MNLNTIPLKKGDDRMVKSEIALELTKLIASDVIKNERLIYDSPKDFDKFAKVISKAYNEIYAAIKIDKD